MNFVTGGTGLLGSHVLLALAQRGEKVRALKRAGSDTAFTRRLFSTVAGGADLFSQIEWFLGDVTDAVSMAEALSGVEKVFHCAAVVSFNSNDKKRLELVNVSGTANLAEAALQAGVLHFMHVSSIATLGGTISGEPVSEGEPWDSVPKGSVYGHTKHAAEMEVWRAMAEGLPAAIVNPSVIIGPGKWNSGSSELFSAVWKGLKYYTRGMNGYVDVRDVSRAMLELSDRKVTGQRFVVNGANISYRELFGSIAKSLDRPAPTILVSPLMGEVAWRLFALLSVFSRRRPLVTRETARSAQRSYSYSSDKLIELTGFKFTPFQETINHTARQFLMDHS